MAAQLFLHIFRMSFTACIVILFVIAIRLLLKKLPKVLSYALWGVVLFRLLCPFSFERPFSLLPAQSQSLSPNLMQISTGIPLIDQNINQLISPQSGFANGSPHSVSWISLVAWLWIAGIILFLIYNLMTLVRLHKKLISAVRVHTNVYFVDEIATPFVIGIIHPKIYLPSDIEAEDQRFVEMHEKMHIRYAHHMIKLIAFFALVVHWFNPLAWVAFILFCKDMEMMCDECVLRNMDGDVRRQYSKTILHLATNKRMLTVLPVAFGEGNTKTRIKNILSYHKVAIWIVISVTILLVVISLYLLSERPSNANKYIPFPAYQVEKTTYNAHIYDIEPFRMYIDLPDGWEVRMPPEEERSSLFFTPVYLYKDDTLMAICGYHIFEAIDETEIPREDYYQVIYSGIRLGSLYRWDDYQPIVNSEYMETALANVYVVQADGMAAAASPTTVLPGILSYNKQLQVYVAVQFSSDTVTEEEREIIAKSIRLS